MHQVVTEIQHRRSLYSAPYLTSKKGAGARTKSEKVGILSEEKRSRRIEIKGFSPEGGQKTDFESSFHRAFERIMEIKHRRTLLDAEELQKINYLEEH